MKKLPPLTKVLSDSSGTAESEFKVLIEKLLIRQSLMHGFEYEQKQTYKDIGIDGIVRKDFFHNIICPVIFHIKWLKGALNTSTVAQQIDILLDRISNTIIDFKSFILITPQDISPEEKVWLGDFSVKYNIDVYHYGYDMILELLNDHPPLKKYYYGEYIEEVPHNFIDLSQKYTEAVIDEVKHLEFIGLPTGQYQKQDLLKKPELKKIYIPLEFGKEKNSSERLSLSEITKKSNRFVILGDPGTGKSTLTKYLALIDSINSDREIESKSKTPFIIPVRDFVRVWESKSGLLNFIDYLKYIAENNYSFDEVDEDFFKAQLDLGKAIVIFDGLDEIVLESGRIRIARDIKRFCDLYPKSSIWITSRVVGYSTDLGFTPDKFALYYIQPVSSNQVEIFVERWYEIQIPKKKDQQKNRIDSLKNAINENPGVQRLKINPLLLTMMTLVHQFEGTLPDDRARLYEKCIELLLKTWQDQKYSTMGIRNPLEERGLNYDEQIRLLAATAFHIQSKSKALDIKDEVENEDEETRGLIEEKELFNILFDARFDRKRMSVESAKEDVRIFLEYIRDKTGLLVEKGKSKNKKNIFTFVHLSFLEYLCAYQIAEDKSKAQWEHIQRLVSFFGRPHWVEIILLSLYIFSKSTGRIKFIDEFARWAFEKMKGKKKPDGWFLMGRAVRDNIDFAADDVIKIIKMLLKIWIKRDKYRSEAFSILNEIALLSRNGRTTLKMLAKNIIKRMSTNTVFDFLCLHERFFKIDYDIIECIESNEDKLDLYPYLPVFKSNENVSKYINIYLKEKDWCLFYNSVSDRVIENLDGIIKNKLNDYELIGCIISSWSRIFDIFRERNFFIGNNKDPSSGLKFRNVKFDFGYADINYPLTLFQIFMSPVNDIQSGKITDSAFVSHKLLDKTVVNDKYFNSWINNTLIYTFSEFKKKLPPNNDFNRIMEKDIKPKVRVFSQEFSAYLSQSFNNDFSRYLNKDLSEDFIRYFELYLSQDFCENFGEHLNQNFNHEFSRYLERDFTWKIKQDLSTHFIKYLKQDFNKDFCLDLAQGLSRFFSSELRGKLRKDLYRDLSQDFSELSLHLYRRKYKKELNWDNLSDLDQDNIYGLFVDEFSNENKKFIDRFYDYLYDYQLHYNRNILFDDTESMSLSFSGNLKNNSSIYSIDLKNSLLIPFIFDLILTAALNHYIINLLVELNNRLFKEQKLTRDTIPKAIEEFSKKNPFLSYIANLSWNFYAKDFNDKSQRDDESSCLRLAVFIISAAKLSLVAGVPCEGDEWEKTLEKAEKTDDPFVQISLTLYKLCNFQEREKNSKFLNKQLEKFKKDHPESYNLIGFTE